MRTEREKLEGKVARARGDRDREASGIWEAAGRGYCPHLSKRGERNEAETRAQGGRQGGGHRAKAQTDAHGCLVCQHDTVVHVVSCVSVLKANREMCHACSFEMVYLKTGALLFLKLHVYRG